MPNPKLNWWSAKKKLTLLKTGAVACGNSLGFRGEDEETKNIWADEVECGGDGWRSRPVAFLPSLANLYWIDGQKTRRVFRRIVLHLISSHLSIPVQCTLKDWKPVLGVRSSSFFRGTGCHSRKRFCFIERSKSSCSFSSSKQQTSQRHRESTQDQRSPLGEVLSCWWKKNHVSPDFLSVPQIATSRPNVTLPPPLNTPCHSIFKPPRMNPYEVLSRDREEIWIWEVANTFSVQFFGSCMLEHNFVLILVILLIRCRGFGKLWQLRMLTTWGGLTRLCWRVFQFRDVGRQDRKGFEEDLDNG